MICRAAVFVALAFAGAASAQPAPPPPPPSASPASPTDPLQRRAEQLEARLGAAATAGALPRAEGENAAIELHSIIAQADQLAHRDGGLTPADRQFISERLDAFTAHFPSLAGAPDGGSPAFALLPAVTTPVGLSCRSHEPRLLAVGRDRASTSVQRSEDVDLTLIVEALANPYTGADTLSLRVHGPGLETRMEAAKSGPYLLAATSANLALKSRRVAVISAEAQTNGAAPHYVKIWGLCQPS